MTTETFIVASTAARQLIDAGLADSYHPAMDILRERAEWTRANVVTGDSVTRILGGE